MTEWKAAGYAVRWMADSLMQELVAAPKLAKELDLAIEDMNELFAYHGIDYRIDARRGNESCN